MQEKQQIAVVGASGYTGADLVRLAVRHPHIEIAALTASSHAGKSLDTVFPHLANLNLPLLCRNDEVDWSTIDVAFCGLPHATSQQVIRELPDHVKVIDISADFRLRDPSLYEATYGSPHSAIELQQQAVYGLTEHYRSEIAVSRLVACPGCYPTAVLTLLLPLVSNGLIDPTDLIIDAKSGLTGAGRGLRQNTLFAESGEGMCAYAVAQHRHAPEIEQELSIAAGQQLTVNFTPHLIPMSRGELVTCYARLTPGNDAADCVRALADRYQDESFVNLSPDGVIPHTQHVRGSNSVSINAYADRIPGRVIMIGALDNLVKGSSGQALQNFNVMFGYDETTGLQQIALFP
ncbi:N-acetyl-gamma-glutamyl-phosphate reductase [Chromatiales bacterium (ex Bugula neritina AB1)]|nr:N-acetyl-gamma-glutamyl-phosphate reductase [Chromatiales bacterium (ex Bugula neritina AB1)]